MAEQVSWRNPGNVSSSVLDPPPGWLAASSTRTRQPERANVSAAISPFGPEPTTTASYSFAMSSAYAPPVIGTAAGHAVPQGAEIDRMGRCRPDRLVSARTISACLPTTRPLAGAGPSWWPRR